MNSGSQSVLSKSTRLMEPLNWRRWPETYKNSGLNILRCIARRPGMDEEFRHRLEQLENRVALLERNQDLIAAGQRRSSLRSLWRRPPMWTFEQYPPRLLNLTAFLPAPAIHSGAPRIAMVTPSYNHVQYIGATIDSIVSQNNPDLYYHVQDGASIDGTLDLLKSRGDSLSWSSEPDKGQSSAINLGLPASRARSWPILTAMTCCCPGHLPMSQITSSHIRMSTSSTAIASSSIARDSRSAAPCCRPMTARRYDMPTTFRKRQCSGASACGTGSGRSTRACTTRWTGTSSCERRPQDSNSHACRDFSPASESMTHKRRHPPMRSASGRWASCGDAFSASNRHRCRSGAPSLLIWRSSWPITTPTSSAC